MDATTGQNGLQQARQFTQSAGVTGIVLTKLDGTAKGGIAVAIARELNLPVRFVGVGEQMSDLLEFSPEAFVDAASGMSFADNFCFTRFPARFEQLHFFLPQSMDCTST